MCRLCCVFSRVSSFNSPIPEKGASLCPFSLMGKLRLRESKSSVPGHTADMWKSGKLSKHDRVRALRAGGGGQVIQSFPAAPLTRLLNRKAPSASVGSTFPIPAHPPFILTALLT